MTDEALDRLRALGFPQDAARTLAEHFAAADAAGRTGHGAPRIEWLASLPGFDPTARPSLAADEPCYQR